MIFKRRNDNITESDRSSDRAFAFLVLKLPYKYEYFSSCKSKVIISLELNLKYFVSLNHFQVGTLLFS